MVKTWLAGQLMAQCSTWLVIMSFSKQSWVQMLLEALSGSMTVCGMSQSHLDWLRNVLIRWVLSLRCSLNKLIPRNPPERPD